MYKPEPIGTITPCSLIISFAMLTLTTFRLLVAFLPPRCIGYWHGRRCFQYFPKEWRCFGQIIISLTFARGNSKTPARARISSYSVMFSLDKWHEFKWEVIESLQSPRRKSSLRPLELPQLPLNLEVLDKKQEIAIFTCTYIRMRKYLGPPCDRKQQQRLIDR